MIKRYITLVILSLLIIGCKAKKLRNQAIEFEKLGEFEQAAQYYFKSLQRNKNDVTALVGYKKNSQIIFDQTLEKFKDAYENENFKAAVYLYKDAEKLKKQAASLDITLFALSDNNIYYEEVKNSYLSKLYVEGIQAIENDNFNTAKTTFKEIVSLDSKYKDSQSKLIEATYEPYYIQGIKYLENDAYRKAYYEFDYILKNEDYKDALALRQEAQEKATIKIAVITTYNNTVNVSDKHKFSSQVKARLNDIPSPFYKIIELTNSRRYKSLEQQLDYAKSKGAKAIFTMNIDDLKIIRGLRSGKTLTAYTKKEVKYKDEEGNPKTKTEYSKASCMQYRQRKRALIDMKFKVISTLDQSILVSDYLTKETIDKIEYAVYRGDRRNLVAGYWKYKNKPHESDRVKDNKYSNRSLQQLIDSRKTLKSDDNLINELIDQVSSSIQYAIADYDPN